jgi:hypothetical protein
MHLTIQRCRSAALYSLVVDNVSSWGFSVYLFHIGSIGGVCAAASRQQPKQQQPKQQQPKQQQELNIGHCKPRHATPWY